MEIEKLYLLDGNSYSYSYFHVILHGEAGPTPLSQVINYKLQLNLSTAQSRHQSGQKSAIFGTIYST